MFRSVADSNRPKPIPTGSDLRDGFSLFELPPHQYFNAMCGAWEIFVLPNPDNRPACLGEPSISISVSGDIGVDLGSPPRSVVLGAGAMGGAPVPETPVDEDRYTRPRK